MAMSSAVSCVCRYTRADDRYRNDSNCARLEHLCDERGVRSQRSERALAKVSGYSGGVNHVPQRGSKDDTIIARGSKHIHAGAAQMRGHCAANETAAADDSKLHVRCPMIFSGVPA